MNYNLQPLYRILTKDICGREIWNNSHIIIIFVIHSVSTLSEKNLWKTYHAMQYPQIFNISVDNNLFFKFNKTYFAILKFTLLQWCIMVHVRIYFYPSACFNRDERWFNKSLYTVHHTGINNMTIPVLIYTCAGEMDIYVDVDFVISTRPIRRCSNGYNAWYPGINAKQFVFNNPIMRYL